MQLGRHQSRDDRVIAFHEGARGGLVFRFENRDAKSLSPGSFVRRRSRLLRLFLLSSIPDSEILLPCRSLF
jgi:hypothetical protein